MRFDDGAKNDSCLIRFLRDAVFPCKNSPKGQKKTPSTSRKAFLLQGAAA